MFIKHLSHLSCFRHFLKNILRKFLNTHSGFLHFSFKTVNSWEPRAAISYVFCTRFVYMEIPKARFTSPLNTQAIRHIAFSFNLHQNLPVCQFPARELIHSSFINVLPYTTPTHVQCFLMWLHIMRFSLG